MLVLVAICGVDERFGRIGTEGNSRRNLPPQEVSALFGDITRFSVAGISDELLESEMIELTGRSSKGGVVGDLLDHVGVGDVEPKLAHRLVQQGFRYELSDNRSVETHRPRLLHADRAP